MSATSEYLKMGGWFGKARALLQRQLEDAAHDPEHWLAGVAKELANGDSARANELFVKAAGALPDDGDMGVLKMAFHTIPLTQAAIHASADMAMHGEFPEGWPTELIAMGSVQAGVLAGVRERNKKAAQAPRGGSTPRALMVEKMRDARRAEQSQKEFLLSAEQGSVEGLTVESEGVYLLRDSEYQEC